MARADEWKTSPMAVSPIAKDKGQRLMASASKVMLENRKIVKLLENASSSPSTNTAILNSHAKNH